MPVIQLLTSCLTPQMWPGLIPQSWHLVLLLNFYLHLLLNLNSDSLTLLLSPSKTFICAVLACKTLCCIQSLRGGLLLEILQPSNQVPDKAHGTWLVWPQKALKQLWLAPLQKDYGELQKPNPCYSFRILPKLGILLGPGFISLLLIIVRK